MLTLTHKVESLRHLMALDESNGDFDPPSLLKEVPSVTLTGTYFSKGPDQYASLGGSARGDRRGAK